jgi:thioredoxin-related protein
MKKKLFYLIFLFSFLHTSAQESISWLSFEEALLLSKDKPKPILIDVYTDWCGYCKKMDQQTYANAVIIKAINTHFYAVKLDGEEKKNIVYKDQTFKFQENGRRGFHQLAAALMNGKISYPTTIFLSETTLPLQSIPGYLDEKTFEKIISYFSLNNYKNSTWEAFEKKFKSNL